MAPMSHHFPPLPELPRMCVLNCGQSYMQGENAAKRQRLNQFA